MSYRKPQKDNWTEKFTLKGMVEEKTQEIIDNLVAKGCKEWDMMEVENVALSLVKRHLRNKKMIQAKGNNISNHPRIRNASQKPQIGS